MAQYVIEHDDELSDYTPTTVAGSTPGLQRRHALSLREYMRDMSLASRRRNPTTASSSEDPSDPASSPPTYAPSLPSPLSLYQHGSEEDDVDEQPPSPREPDEYPFPATPLWSDPTREAVKTPKPAPDEYPPALYCPPPVPASAPTSPTGIAGGLPKRHRTFPTNRSKSIQPDGPLLDQQRMSAALAMRSPHHRATSSIGTGKAHSSPLTPPESLVAGTHHQETPFWQQELQWRREAAAYMKYNMDPAANGSRYSMQSSSSPAVPSVSRTPDLVPAVPESTNANDQDGQALVSGQGGSHFGSAARDRLADVMTKLLDSVPVALKDHVINIVEYGALHSRSSSLVSGIISQLAGQVSTPTASTAEPSFQVVHVDAPHVDFRPLVVELESSSESYLSAKWAASHDPTLTDRVFSSTIARPLSSKVLPRASVSVGFSVMALQWPFTERKLRQASASLAHAELMAFLAARTHEFEAGGVLGLAYISRSENNVKPVNPRHFSDDHSAAVAVGNHTDENGRARGASVSYFATQTSQHEDIWTILTGILSHAIQRLVSTGLLQPAIARQLLALPLHPRTPRQTKAVLDAMSHSWSVEHEEVMNVMHPAWVGLAHQTVSPSSYTEQTVSILKVFWEAEARAILREALGSKAASEMALESLFDVAREKIDERGPQPLELEVQILVLRRKS